MQILFLGPTYVGDAVVASGLIDHLSRGGQPVSITLVCGEPAAPVLANLPGVERVIPFVKRRMHLHWLDIWRATINRRWDWVIDLRASGIAYGLRARRRSVYTPRANNQDHRTARWARTIGLEQLPQPRLNPTPVQAEAARALIPPGSPVIGLGPTANWAGKIWPADRFAELSTRLTAANGPFPGARIAIFGAEGDRASLLPLVTAIPENRCIDLVGKTDLMTAYAALTHCDLYVGNDSGLLYMSVAADIPSVGLVGPSLTLFGPERPPLVAPWAPKTGIVRTPISYQEFISADNYDHRTTGSLMDSLTVDAAETGIRALLDRVAGEKAQFGDGQRC